MVHGIQSIFNTAGKYWASEREEAGKLEDELWRVLSERTRIKRNQVRGRKEHYFSTAEAVKVGLIDEVLDPRQAFALTA